jgi:hypothetical protein
MRAGAVAATIFTLLGMTAVPAQADTKVLATSGNWQAFGGTTGEGAPVCGVSLGANDKYLGVKAFTGSETFTIQLGSNTWQVVDKTKVKVSLRIDGDPAWNADGTAFHFKDGDAGLEFDLDKLQVGRFMTQFRNGKLLQITFEGGGKMAEWRLSLAGTDEVSDAFIGCTRKM